MDKTQNNHMFCGSCWKEIKIKKKQKYINLEKLILFLYNNILFEVRKSLNSVPIQRI